MTVPSRDLVATGSQTVGPFFHFGLSPDTQLGRIAGPDTMGEPIRLRVRVTDGAGEPVPDALVELWQVDASGAPSPASSAPRANTFCGWGRLATDGDGACEFATVRPGLTSGPDEPRQAPHVNVCLFMRGLLRHVYTRLYFAGDPALPGDPVLSLVPEERRATLVAHPAGADAWQFEIRLQGDRETVFFDI